MFTMYIVFFSYSPLSPEDPWGGGAPFSLHKPDALRYVSPLKLEQRNICSNTNMSLLLVLYVLFAYLILISFHHPLQFGFCVCVAKFLLSGKEGPTL